MYQFANNRTKPTQKFDVIVKLRHLFGLRDNRDSSKDSQILGANSRKSYRWNSHICI